MDGREPQIHEVWTFGEDGVTREVHPTARVDVGAGFVREFSTNYLTESCRRFPMFGRKLMEVPNGWAFLTSSGPMEQLGLPISWFPMLFGGTEVLPPLRTGVVNLGGLPVV